MAKILKITTNSSVETIDIDFKRDANLVNEEISALIECDYYTTYKPFALLSILNINAYNYDENKKGLLLLIDDEGALKESPKVNEIASIFAGTTIVGNCLLVGTEYLKHSESFDFCSIDDNHLIMITTMIEKYYQVTSENCKVENDNKCVTCIKLNKENGGTLPIICPRTDTVCIGVSKARISDVEIENDKTFKGKTVAEAVKEIANAICKENKKIEYSQACNTIFKVLTKNEFSDLRTRMSDEGIVSKETIDFCLDEWDRLIEKGNKEILTYERY